MADDNKFSKMYRISKARVPEKLENICIRNIAKVVASSAPHENEHDEILLPGRFVQAVVYEIDNMDKFGPHQLKCLLEISNNIDIELHYIRHLDQNEVVEMLTRFGHKLTALEMSYYYLVSETQLVDLVRATPNLTCLRLRGTMVNDDVIKTLSEVHYSSSLLELDIRFCVGLTDKCVDYLTRLKKLVALDVSDNRISVKAIHTLLQKLPNLQYFYSNCTVNDVLTLSPGGATNLSANKTLLNLRDIRINAKCIHNEHANYVKKYPTKDIALLCDLCPKLQEVEIYLRAMENKAEGLFCLTTLSCLRGLTVDGIGGEVNYKTFDEVILPLLLESGSRLEELSLRCIPNIDRRAIARACPKIKSLNIFSINDYMAYEYE